MFLRRIRGVYTAGYGERVLEIILGVVSKVIALHNHIANTPERHSKICLESN
jgi:hypothetical protein